MPPISFELRPLMLPRNWRGELTTVQQFALTGNASLAPRESPSARVDLKKSAIPRGEQICGMPVTRDVSTMAFACTGILRTVGPLSIIRIAGPLVTNPDAWWYDACPIPMVCEAAAIAMRNGSAAVMLEFDCYGGEVYGSSDLEAALRGLAKAKPVYAIARGACYSAAYWAACCGARELVATPSGGVGSIGIVMGPYVDASKHNEQEGFVVHSVGEPDGKAEILDDKVSPEFLANVKAAVQQWFKPFAAAVSQARGLTPAEISRLNAGIFAGDEAVKNKLVDRIIGFEAFAQELITRHTPKPTPTMTGQQTPGATRPQPTPPTPRTRPMAISTDDWKSMSLDDLKNNRPDLCDSCKQEPAATLAQLKAEFPGVELAAFREECQEKNLSIGAARVVRLQAVSKEVEELRKNPPAPAANATNTGGVAGTIKPAPGSPAATTAGTAAVNASTRPEAGAAAEYKTWPDAVRGIMKDKSIAKAAAIAEANRLFPKLRAEFVDECRRTGKAAVFA